MTTDAAGNLHGVSVNSGSTIEARGFYAPEGRDIEVTLDLASGDVLDRR